MPNNGDLEFLNERQERMQAFLIGGIGRLMLLREQPDKFETLRELLVACDHYAVMTQMQVEWSSPFELLQQLLTRDALTEHPEVMLRCDSPEYIFWSQLVLRARDTRNVTQVLRTVLGSCCFTADCVNFDTQESAVL